MNARSIPDADARGSIAAQVAAEVAAQVESAVAVLARGGLVGLPTETVYGLAADAGNPEAVRKIFALKGRPANHPVIVHLADVKNIEDWAIDIPPLAWRLAEAFWPGPMTLILKRASHVSDGVTGKQDSVGLRVPSHPMAHAVLSGLAAVQSGRPSGIAAPSANKFGRVSPTTAQHVRDEFGEAIDLVLDGGQSQIGIESTIIDLTATAPRILRPGSITKLALHKALGSGDNDARSKRTGPAGRGTPASAETDPTQTVPRVSGALNSHYSPRTRTVIASGDELATVLGQHAGQRIAVLSFKPVRFAKTLHWRASAQPRVYSHNLYAHLRAMDVAGCDLLVVEAPPTGPDWDGINDRLSRAAFDSKDAPEGD